MDSRDSGVSLEVQEGLVSTGLPRALDRLEHWTAYSMDILEHWIDYSTRYVKEGSFPKVLSHVCAFFW